MILHQGDPLPDELLDYDGWFSVLDMRANNWHTFASVEIFVGRCFCPEITAAEYICFVTGYGSVYDFFGDEVFHIPHTTRIGLYDWYSYETIMQIEDMSFFDRTFVNVHDGIVRRIRIGYNAFSESLDDILLMFGEIDTVPIPAPVPILLERPVPPEPEFVFEMPPADHPLIGTWVAEDSITGRSYVFEPDGTGNRERINAKFHDDVLAHPP